jgi:hypothetical protein
MYQKIVPKMILFETTLLKRDLPEPARFGVHQCSQVPNRFPGTGHFLLSQPPRLNTLFLLSSSSNWVMSFLPGTATLTLGLLLIVFFLIEDHARAADYRPCGVCLPAAYASWRGCKEAYPMLFPKS